jgi:hypothetical protein
VKSLSHLEVWVIMVLLWVLHFFRTEEGQAFLNEIIDELDSMVSVDDTQTSPEPEPVGNSGFSQQSARVANRANRPVRPVVPPHSASRAGEET